MARRTVCERISHWRDRGPSPFGHLYRRKACEAESHPDDDAAKQASKSANVLAAEAAVR